MRDPVRLFISHSSDDAAMAAAVAQGLAQTPGIQPLIDCSGLEPGRDWRRDLHEWMARCGAAVVLLTPAVLARPKWVLKEAIVLGWRFDLEADFRLLFALAPGLSRQDFLDQGFGLAQFGEPQLLQTPAALADVPALVAEVASVLPAEQPRTPFDDLAELLSSTMQVADPGGTTYPVLAKQLGLQTPATYGPDKRAQLADEVARAIVRGRDDLLALDKLVQVLTPWNKESRLKVLQMLRPYWVDAQAAAMLLRRARQPAGAGGPGAVVIAGEAVAEFTAETCVRRAFNIDLGAFRMAPAVSLEGGDLHGEIRRELCQHARAENWVLRSTKSDDIVVNKLRSVPFLIVVPLTELPDPATIAALRNDFPRAVFIAPRPSGMPDDAALDALELLPRPPSGREASEYQGYQLAMSAIGNL